MQRLPNRQPVRRLVAYDRNYILNAIQEINPYHSHVFLEKIFQLEFTLPPISKKVIQAELIKKINPMLTENGQRGFKYLLEKGFDFLEYGDGDLTSLFIHNMRDVVRFTNSLKLSYEFVKDEIYFPDFYNLELIRFKTP